MKEFSLIAMLCAAAGCTHTQPFFAPGHDPTLSGAVWEPVGNMSDEFDGDALENRFGLGVVQFDLETVFGNARAVADPAVTTALQELAFSESSFAFAADWSACSAFALALAILEKYKMFIAKEP